MKYETPTRIYMACRYVMKTDVCEKRRKNCKWVSADSSPAVCYVNISSSYQEWISRVVFSTHVEE